MKQLTVKELVLVSLMVALIILLGYVTIPMPSGLNITFSLIPMAIAAIALGWRGGAIAGGAFGLVSFLQCFGICGYSKMGAELLAEANTFLTWLLLFIQRFLPRLADGIILGLVFRFLVTRMRGIGRVSAACSVTGFLAALINTALFMSLLVLLFSSYDYMQDTIAGRAFFVYLFASVGVNGLVEMGISTVAVGAIGTELYKAKLIVVPEPRQKNIADGEKQ